MEIMDINRNLFIVMKATSMTTTAYASHLMLIILGILIQDTRMIMITSTLLSRTTDITVVVPLITTLIPIIALHNMSPGVMKKSIAINTTRNLRLKAPSI